MEKTKYRKEKINNYKIIVILIILILILVFFSIFLSHIYKKDQIPELSYDNLTTIQEVIEYYESKYISEKESKDSQYILEVFLEFKYLPYNENNESNEEYYNKLLEDCAKILKYQSFKMIDKKNDLNVEIVCDGKKIKSIIINGVEDYFIYMDSQISMKEFKEINLTNFNIQSEELQNIINNNWNSDTDLGIRDSIFNNYYIYFNKGIKTRTIDKKLYNIVFDKKYKGNVVNNIFPGMDFSSIEAILGEATFKDDDNKIIGYKGEDEYIFFTDSEISVYKTNKIDTNDFFDLVDKYLKEELNFLEFMNELTYLWPDYSDYKYTSNSVFISYPTKGVAIKLNYDDLNGIYIFNNIKSPLSKVERYLDNTNFVARLQLDLVFETEKRRYEENNNWLKLCKEYKESLDEEKKSIIRESLNYAEYPEVDNYNLIYSIKFISKYGDQPNRELSDTINSYLWVNSDLFLYSKKGKGIYTYDLKTGTISRVITGEEDYDLKGFEDGILKYDNTEIKI